MRTISLWAAGLHVAQELPIHLEELYRTIGRENFERDPEVCAEREPVPIEELLEPFLLDEKSSSEATTAAKHASLRLAAVVVAVYTFSPPAVNKSSLPAGGLRFIGSFFER